MKRIRTKMILAMLAMTLLPVYPVYHLIRGLLQQSIEVGYNETVETALDAAANISRTLNAKYREETLEMARSLAALSWVDGVQSAAIRAEMASHIRKLGPSKVELFGADGRLIFTYADSTGSSFPPLYQNKLAALKDKIRPELLSLDTGPGYIIAFAPVPSGAQPVGFIILTRLLDENFTSGRQHIVSVNQMFKTLEFFEGHVSRGFLLSFFAVYAPIALLSIALGAYFSGKITQPLQQLVDSTSRVAEGDWEHRVQITSKDEVGELVAAFNHMIGTLKEKQDQVIALEKMAAWREIARILAHEIKNPLTPIQLTVQQVKDKYPGDDPDYQKLLADCLEIVTDEIESLRTLVREFSDFARMPKLNLVPGDLNELLYDLEKLYQDDIVVFSQAPSLPEIQFDYEKMRRVLINLIENALDSLPDRRTGSVSVQTRRENGTVLLEVADSGTGIPPEARDKIFEPYFSTKKSGVGLGLAIVKRIVDEHGAEISLTSEVGSGTVFGLRFSK